MQQQPDTNDKTYMINYHLYKHFSGLSLKPWKLLTDDEKKPWIDHTNLFVLFIQRELHAQKLRDENLEIVSILEKERETETE